MSENDIRLVQSCYQDMYELTIREIAEALAIPDATLTSDGVSFDGWFDEAKAALDRALGGLFANDLIARLNRAIHSIGSGIDAKLKRIPSVNVSNYMTAGQDLVERFRDRNVELIRTIPDTVLTSVKTVLAENPNLHVEALTEQLRKVTNYSQKQAKFRAVDQTLKLHGDLVQAKHESLGIESYVWVTSDDERVRQNPAGADHKYLHNTVVRYDSPPIVDHRTQRRCHAGRDYWCRCTQDPILPE